MVDILLAIAPIFVLIVLGYGLRRGGIPSFEFWNLNDKLVYWVLFPALLFHKMATMDFGSSPLGGFALVVYAGLGAAVVFALLAGWACRIERPTWSSVLQGCMRHNTFIALAVAERVFGPEGLALAVLNTALLIPVTNIFVVALVLLILHGIGGKGVARAIARDLFRNPLLIAVCLGLMVNITGIEDIPVLLEVSQILGAAALPIVLLCVGANIRIRVMTASVVPTLLAITGKLIVFPAVVVGMSVWIGLDALSTSIALVFGAVPTAASAYTLARQMGGDAPVMAAIVTIQTGISFVTLPLTLLAAEYWLTAGMV